MEISKEQETTLLNIISKASEVALYHYNKEYQISAKSDFSPITEVDLLLDHMICEDLIKIFPDIPIISEEGEFAARYELEKFWLVDPIDGTKGFIAKNGQFSINIGLIVQGVPVFGIIAAPVDGKIYYNSMVDKAAYCQEILNKSVEQIKCSQNLANKSVLASIHHKNGKTDNFIKLLQPEKITLVSSALKFCYLARGVGDIYPCFYTTMAWDTAAGQAIVESAGGCVLYEDHKPITYSSINLQNSNFIAYGYRK